jgi:hypothetical protein
LRLPTPVPASSPTAPRPSGSSVPKRRTAGPLSTVGAGATTIISRPSGITLKIYVDDTENIKCAFEFQFAAFSRCRSACDVDPALPLPSPPPLPPSSSSSRPNTFSRSSCRLAPDSGPCIQRTPRFYFSGNFSDCLIFSYGGCAGNENNFFSERECRGRCGVGNRPPTTPHPPPPPVRRPDSCLMPADPGLFCNHDEAGGGTVQRFYFDSGSAQCHRFLYAGCGGNENNFSRKEKCDMRCGAATHAGYSFEAN